MVDLTDYVSKRYGLTLPLLIRPGTSDAKAALEVLEHNAYQRPQSGFGIQPGDRWLDAGANIGAFTMQAIHHGAALVVAVEPVPDHIDVLVKNIAAHPKADRATEVLQGAVTPPGFTDPVSVYERLNPEHQWRTSTARMTHQPTTSYRTKAYPIDALVADYSLDAVKLDVEDAEHDIMRLWDPADTVRKVVIEWGFEEDHRTAPLIAWLDRWIEAGWTIGKIHTRIREFDLWDPSWTPRATLIFATR